MSKLDNALKMLQLLSARSVVSLHELADVLEVNIRTVQRLKEDLEYSGYTIETVMGPGGGYHLKSNTSLLANAFTMEEKRKLKQVLALMLHQNVKTYDVEFTTLVSKLSQHLNVSSLENTTAFQSVKLNVDPNLYTKNLSDIETAITHHRVVLIDYQKNHKTQRSYQFQPYELIMVNQFWYVYGYDQLNRYLSLKLIRISAITVLEKTFLKDNSKRVGPMLSDYGYTIEPTQAVLEISNMDYLSEYIWGKEQTIEWLDDHKFIMNVVFPNKPALLDFALRGGHNIKVLSPAWLVSHIVESYENAIKMYKM